jgi:hypothetical protein
MLRTNPANTFFFFLSVSIKTFTIAGDFKVMVTSGNTANGASDTVEIIDLETTRSNCQNFPLLPSDGRGGSGAFVDNAHPIVCGGYDSSNGGLASSTGFDKYECNFEFFTVVCSTCNKDLEPAQAVLVCCVFW